MSLPNTMSLPLNIWDRQSTVSPVRISVIIPAFNAQRFVGAAVASVQAQTEGNLEIIVVDDGSADATASVIRRIAEADPRVRLIRQETNRGPGAARNAAIRAAQGEWLALLDADDRMEARRLATLVARAEREKTDMISDNLLLVPEDDPSRAAPMLAPASFGKARLMRPAEFVRGNIGSRRSPRVSYGFMQPVIRKSFLDERAIRYDECNRFGEDFLLYLECLLRGARWWVTPEPMYAYTVRRGSLTEKQSAADLQRIRSMESVLLKAPATQGDRALRQILRRHKRTVDRSYHYRAFTDAVKTGRVARAGQVLLESPAAAFHIAHESLMQAPTIIAKAWRGGYRLSRQQAS